MIAPQRRVTSHRKAKGQSNAQVQAHYGNDDEFDEADFVDSDTDPAWTPQQKVC